MIRQPRDWAHRKSRRLVWFMVALLLLPPFNALALDIIFDPSNFAKNVQQVVALVRQTERAATQIFLQETMLAHLPVSVGDALAVAGQSLNAQLHQNFPVIHAQAADVGQELDSRYPIEFHPPTPGWLETMRSRWRQAQRENVLHERDLIHHVHDQMAPTAQRLTTILEASNGIDAKHDERPGVVAGAQAHEELLALCAGELDKLIAIRVARAQRQVERRANVQAENAYAAARRDALLKNWPVSQSPKSETVRFPF